eukprot:5421708-Pyramimonas_sp.AAC.1
MWIPWGADNCARGSQDALCRWDRPILGERVGQLVICPFASQGSAAPAERHFDGHYVHRHAVVFHG